MDDINTSIVQKIMRYDAGCTFCLTFDFWDICCVWTQLLVLKLNEMNDLCYVQLLCAMFLMNVERQICNTCT